MKAKTVWLLVAVIIISLLHYLSPVQYHHLHAIYQRLYYVPIILASYWFGMKGGLGLAILSGASYLPHIIFQWSFHPHEAFTQYVEIVMFLVVASMVGVLSDIQRKQRRRIEEAMHQIRRMDRLSLLGQLAAGLAHEIRNPLGGLIGSAEILQTGLEKGHPKREFADIMLKELSRLKAKLNEFLFFAKPAAPQIVPNDINDVVKASVSLVEKQASRSGVSVRLQLDEAIPMIPMDSEQIKQVVLNLMLNSVQAMPEGGSITVCTCLTKNGIRLSIEDQGEGISREDLEKIYEPFFTTKPEGTGLGLAIVRQLVDGMGGSIQAVPLETGTRFEIGIPHGQN